MIDQVKMNQLKEHGGAAALELRAEMFSALKARTDETMKAIGIYFSDKKEKVAAIAGRIEELEAQREALEAEVAAMGPDLAAATISGDINTMEQIQGKLTDLEARKAATSAQVELLNGVSVAGDETLFNAADEKARALDQFWTESMDDLSALASFADEQVSLWRQVANLSTLGGDLLPRNTVFAWVRDMQKDFQEAE